MRLCTPSMDPLPEADDPAKRWSCGVYGLVQRRSGTGFRRALRVAAFSEYRVADGSLLALYTDENRGNRPFGGVVDPLHRGTWSMHAG